MLVRNVREYALERGIKHISKRLKNKMQIPGVQLILDTGTKYYFFTHCNWEGTHYIRPNPPKRHPLDEVRIEKARKKNVCLTITEYWLEVEETGITEEELFVLCKMGCRLPDIKWIIPYHKTFLLIGYKDINLVQFDITDFQHHINEIFKPSAIYEADSMQHFDTLYSVKKRKKDSGSEDHSDPGD